MTVEWDKDDRLYLFRMPQAFWEGSSTPRSSLGMPLALEHIESIMPQVMGALFADDPPFSVDPRPKTSMEAARAVKELLAYQMENMQFKEEMRIGIKECLNYGTAFWKWGWKRYTKQRATWKRKGAPKMEPTDAGPVTLPTAKSQQTKRILEDFEVNEPFLECRHVRWVIPDQSTFRPDVRKAKFLVERDYMDVSQLEEWRDIWNLPSTDELLELFFPPKETPERSLLEGRSTSSVLNTGVSSLDINMEFRAMPRWQEPSADPAKQPLEVLEYWSNDRHIVVLQRKLCLCNELNPYGRIPFLSCNYIDVLDSLYGIGVTKLIGSEQRLQQGVINARLDDLSLRLSGTFLRKRAGNTPTQQLRLRPGGIIDSDDEKGVQMIQYPPAIVDAFTEVEASDARSQRRTGANEIVTQGGLEGPSSITRTASGMQTLSAGVGARMGYLMDFVANLVVIPALEAFHEMNGMWLDPEEIDRILSEELNAAYKGDAIDLKNARCKFSMKAGQKYRSKQMMAQSLVPLTQTLLNPQIMEALQDHDQKIDIAELVQMYYDVSNWPNRQSLIVQLTDEDKQRIQAKSEQAMQSNLEAQKHGHRMAEIEQKGITQAGAKVVENLAEHAHPDAVNGAQEGEEGGGPEGQPGAES